MKTAYSKMKIITTWRCVNNNNTSYTVFRNYKELQKEPKQKNKQTNKQTNKQKSQTNKQEKVVI